MLMSNGGGEGKLLFVLEDLRRLGEVESVFLSCVDDDDDDDNAKSGVLGGLGLLDLDFGMSNEYVVMVGVVGVEAEFVFGLGERILGDDGVETMVLLPVATLVDALPTVALPLATEAPAHCLRALRRALLVGSAVKLLLLSCNSRSFLVDLLRDLDRFRSC
mmetsp:Transcript_22650/g.49495  ORF Transcript_22650/g.49495 Transcript_22650/m.49495 type:complete len:161 (-) Transcript_22650:1162-1644(-)